MVASNRIKIASLAVSLGIVFSSGLSQAAQAKSSKKVSSQTTKSARTAAPQGDDQAVRSTLTEFSKLLAAGDAKTLSALWTEDGEYVDEDGNQTKGRKEIEKRFTQVFSQDGRPNVQLSADTIKFLAPSVALIEGSVLRHHDGETTPATHFSLVMVKGDSGWLLTRAAERTIVATSNYDYLRRFEWIIGDWSAQNGAASVHMKAEWVPSKNFILCKYESQNAEGKQSVDMQIIGWDPLDEQPRSWHFDSRGGFGQGVWANEKNHWVCETSGVESDGSRTKSRNVITVNGPDSFTWSSVARSVDGMAVGDAPELQVKRTVR